MTKREKAILRTLLFVSQHGKIAPFPHDDAEMEEIYTKLERGKLVDVNGYSAEWWLTYEGERELSRLRGLTFLRKLARAGLWLLSIVLSGVVLYIVGRLMDSAFA